MAGNYIPYTLPKITQLTTPIDTGALYNWVYNRTLMTQSGTDYIGNIEYRTSLTTPGKQYFLQRVHNPTFVKITTLRPIFSITMH
jgi:hypothetical protein